jgi:hypothetical protein
MKGKPLTADHWRVRAAFAQVLGMDDGASWEDIGRRMKPSMRDSQQDALPAPHGDRSDRHADMPTRASGITEQPASTSDSSSAPSKPSAGTPVFSQTRLRYQILMADGTHPDPKAEFFVLRMDPGAGDPHHREASLDGLAMYVRTLQDHHPGLAAEIQALYPGLLGRLKTYEASQETPAGKESEPLRESDGDTSTPGDGADEVIGFIKRGFSAFKDIAMQLLDARLPDQGAISPHAVPGLKSSMRPMMIEMGVPPHLADRWMDAKILDIRPLIRAHLQRSEEPDVSDATCLFIWHVLLAYGAVVSSDPFQ